MEPPREPKAAKWSFQGSEREPKWAQSHPRTPQTRPRTSIGSKMEPKWRTSVLGSAEIPWDSLGFH